MTSSQSISFKVLSNFRQQFAEIYIQLESGCPVNAPLKLSKEICVVVAALLVDGREQNELLERRVIASIPRLTVA